MFRVNFYDYEDRLFASIVVDTEEQVKEAIETIRESYDSVPGGRFEEDVTIEVVREEL